MGLHSSLPIIHYNPAFLHSLSHLLVNATGSPQLNDLYISALRKTLGPTGRICEEILPFFLLLLILLISLTKNRDAKTYQRADNVGVKKNPISGRIFAKFYAVLLRK